MHLILSARYVIGIGEAIWRCMQHLRLIRLQAAHKAEGSRIEPFVKIGVGQQQVSAGHRVLLLAILVR